VAKAEMGLSKLNVTLGSSRKSIKGMPSGNPARISVPCFIRRNGPALEAAGVTVVEPEMDDTGAAGLSKNPTGLLAEIQMMLSCRDRVASLGVSWPVEVI
jgi:hypothetical protein